MENDCFDMGIPIPDPETEYIKSVVRIANFIDNFSDFMYYNIQEAIKNIPETVDEIDVSTFLTSLRKEISDFHTKVKSLRERFDI